MKLIRQYGRIYLSNIFIWFQEAPNISKSMFLNLQ